MQPLNELSRARQKLIPMIEDTVHITYESAFCLKIDH